MNWALPALVDKLLDWPLYASDEGRISCGAGCDPAWSWDGRGRRPTFGEWADSLAEHIRIEHPDGAPCT